MTISNGKVHTERSVQRCEILLELLIIIGTVHFPCQKPLYIYLTAFGPRHVFEDAGQTS